jgi:hypothetical protein
MRPSRSGGAAWPDRVAGGERLNTSISSVYPSCWLHPAFGDVVIGEGEGGLGAAIRGVERQWLLSKYGKSPPTMALRAFRLSVAVRAPNREERHHKARTSAVSTWPRPALVVSPAPRQLELQGGGRMLRVYNRPADANNLVGHGAGHTDRPKDGRWVFVSDGGRAYERASGRRTRRRLPIEQVAHAQCVGDLGRHDRLCPCKRRSSGVRMTNRPGDHRQESVIESHYAACHRHDVLP